MSKPAVKAEPAAETIAPPPPAAPPPDKAEPTPGSAEADELEGNETEVDAQGPAGPAFDVEAFVKSLPDGVCLCPQCIGMGAVVEEPPFDPYTHMCPTCDGWGRVRTGSMVGGQGEVKCRDCDGNGWQPNDPDQPPATPASAAALASPNLRDIDGRTPDDPEFKWAQVVSAIELPPAPAPAAEPAAVA